MDERLAEALFWISLIILGIAVAYGIWWLGAIGIAIQAALLFIGTR